MVHPLLTQAPHLRLRCSEWTLAAYFAYTVALAWCLPAPPTLRIVLPLANLAVVSALALLARAHALREHPLLGVLRDWFPLPLLLLTYREIGWFARPAPAHALEHLWIGWDRALLDGGLRAAVESLGPVIPALLEICYSLVYAVGPLSLGVLYVLGRRRSAERFLFVFVLAVVLCYVQYPLWPSEPPRTVFPGLDAPAYASVFRRFNLWYLTRQGIHTAVFPSTHIAGAFAAAFAMRDVLADRRWVGRVWMAMACAIATATVYGRYHYLADGVAGCAVAWLASVAARSLPDRSAE